MDAIQLILRDHREVDRLFKGLERADRAGERARRRRDVQELVRELSVHAAIEEQHLYPALRDAGADARVLDALEAHHAVKVTLAELEALPPDHERFQAKVRLLAESVRRHVAEEEEQLLPLLERTFDDDRRRALGDALERAKGAAPTRPHPAAPDTPPGVFVAGALAAVYDRGRDALRSALDLVRTILAQALGRSLEGARGLATRAQQRGVEVAAEAAEQGRAAIGSGLERGREVMGGAREVTARVELRGAQAASTVARRGRSAARKTRRGGARRGKAR